jgi:flavin-binding protein dodecin
MSGTWKMIEIVGTSPVSFSDAVKNAVAEAGKTLRGMAWLEVVEQRGAIEGGAVREFQVKVKIGFKLESAARAVRARRK